MDRVGNNNNSRISNESNGIKTRINSNKGNPIIGNSKNSSFSKGLLYQRGIKMLKDIGENGKISEGEKLRSMERKFPTILKVIVGVFTIGIGTAIMYKIEKKYHNEDLSARKEIANELAKLGHAIENGKTEEIKFCGEDIKVTKGKDGKFSIEYGGKKVETEGELLIKNIENNVAQNVDLLGEENAINFLKDSMLSGGKLLGGERFRELADKVLKSTYNVNLKDLGEYVPDDLIYKVVQFAAIKNFENDKGLIDFVKECTQEILIDSEDVLELRCAFEKAKNEDAGTVKSKVSIEAGKVENKSLEKINNTKMDVINKADQNQEQNKTTTQDGHNFVADIILNDDAFIHDKNVFKPGERLKQTFIKHSETLTALLNDKASLDSVGGDFKKVIKIAIFSIRALVNTSKLFSKDFTIDEVKTFLEGKNPETFSKMEKEIDNAVENAANQMQDSLSEQLKRICGGNSNVGTKDDYEMTKAQFGSIDPVVKSLNKKKNLSNEEKEILNEIANDATKICDLCEQSKNLGLINEELNSLLEEISKKEIGNIEIKNAKGCISRIKYALLKDKLENALSYLEKNGENIDGFESEKLIGIPKIIEDLKNGKEVTSDMINGTGNYEPNNDNIDPTKLKEDLKKGISILNVKINNLKTLMAQSGTDLNSDGYGKFMQKVMGRYMKEIPLIDKRSMVAAGIRYYQKSKPLVEPKKENFNSDKEYKSAMYEYENFNAKEASKQFGAILKGAGPIMQKMLQGLKTGNEEFDGAIEDMKSNLAPINEEMIKAYLYDAVEKSNGQIKNITVKKSLGAASVGQALLCEIEDKDGNKNKKECVVKLLRPDVYNRAMREKEIFEQAAREVPGMEITFDGQLKSIMDELDLTKEAENVEDGKVYNNTFNDVKSMNIIRPPEPTKNVLILEKAPGQTIDSYINKDKEGGVYKNVVDLIDEIKNSENKLATQDEVVRIKDALDELLRAQRALINLSTLWVIKGIYGNGFYHGDLHAGNMMIDPNVEEIDKTTGETKKNAKLTVIDFGNATKLTKDQQSNIMLMMASASVGDEGRFMKGFRKLLTESGKKDWDKKQDVLRRIFKEVLNKGDEKSTGERIAVALTEAQKQGIEIPAPIFKFSQCQIRLSNAVDSINKAMKNIVDEIYSIDFPEELDDQKIFKGLKKSVSEANNPKTFFDCMADVIDSNLTSSLWKLGLWDAFRIKMQMK